MAFDRRGTFLVAGGGANTVFVLDPAGALIDTIDVGRGERVIVTNLCFGGAGGDTLFITVFKGGRVLGCHSARGNRGPPPGGPLPWWSNAGARIGGWYAKPHQPRQAGLAATGVDQCFLDTGLRHSPRVGRSDRAGGTVGPERPVGTGGRPADGSHRCPAPDFGERGFIAGDPTAGNCQIFAGSTADFWAICISTRYIEDVYERAKARAVPCTPITVADWNEHDNIRNFFCIVGDLMWEIIRVEPKNP